jgi:hypothetical protein
MSRSSLRFRSLVKCVAGSIGLLTLVSTAHASTHRDLRNPAEVATNIDVGPTINPDGSHGQYFLDSLGRPQLRTHEFYDDPFDNDASFIPLRIKDLWGQVIGMNVVDRSGVNHVTDFTLRVSITNYFDPGGQPFAHSGITQLNERNSNLALLQNRTMQEVLLTTEFARLPGNRPVQINVGTDESFYNENLVDAGEALSTGPTSPQIIAQNADARAWYGITPGSSRSPTVGNYIVPTFNFGDILPGETATRDINFSVEALGIPDGEQRYEALEASFLFWRYNLPVSDPLYIAPPDPLTAAMQKNFADVLYAHSSDLKVGNYLDTLQTHLTQRNNAINFQGLIPIGNASVFYNIPEPATLGLLCGVAVMSLRRRRRK